MKKIILIAFAAILSFQIAISQELGFRVGDIVGNTVAADFVFAFKTGRIHSDISFGNGVGVEILYDFIYRPLGKEALYFYIGAGGFAWFGEPFNLGIPAEIGLEYRFRQAPLALGFDWRPAFRIIENTDFVPDRFGLNFRFVF